MSNAVKLIGCEQLHTQSDHQRRIYVELATVASSIRKCNQASGNRDRQTIRDAPQLPPPSDRDCVPARLMAQSFLWLLILGAFGSFTLGFSCGAVTFALTWGPVIGAKVHVCCGMVCAHSLMTSSLSGPCCRPYPTCDALSLDVCAYFLVPWHSNIRTSKPFWAFPCLAALQTSLTS